MMNIKRKEKLIWMLLAIMLVVFTLFIGGCGRESYSNEVEHVHSYGKWEVIEESSCGAEGLKRQTCECGESNEERIEKSEHIRGDWQTLREPACEKDGKRVIKCSICGEILQEDSIEKLSHVGGDWTTTIFPACTNEGITALKCILCNEVLETRTLQKLPHEYGEWVVLKSATCIEYGIQKRSCILCRIDETRDSEKVNHIEREEQTQPTCSVQGEKRIECTACGTILSTSVIETTGHRYSDWAVKKTSTCTQAGIEERTCAECKDYQTQEIEKRGHTEVIDNAVSATKFSVGKTEGKHCNVCNLVLVEQKDIEYSGLEIKSHDGYDEIGSKPVHLYKEADNDILTYDFTGDFTFYTTKLTWSMYSDEGCVNEIRNISLSVGENTAYIGVKSTITEDRECYKVTIRRLGMKEYTFIVEEEVIARGSIQEKSNLNEPTAKPQKTGYSFNFWSLNEKSEEVIFPYKVMQDIVFKAVFEANTYVVTFDSDGGTICENAEYTYDANYTLPQPTRSGYTFEGWYNNDEKVTGGTWGIAKDCTLTAHWQVAMAEYTVKHILQNIEDNEYGIEYEIEIMTATSGARLTPQVKTLTGFVSPTPQEITILGDGSTYLIYKYDRQSYAVTFNVVNGVTETKELRYGEILRPQVREGYIFRGWYKDYTRKQRVNIVTESIALYGKLQSITAASEFEIIDGEGITIKKYIGTTESVTIPQTINGKFVTAIASRAFAGSKITSVTITDNVTSVGDSAFYYCALLKELVIGKNVSAIGVSAFSQCKLNDIEVDEENTTYTSKGNCLINTRTKTLISGCKNSEIPADGSVEIIGSNAFAGLVDLTRLVIPDTVTTIEDYAFSSCAKLEFVTLGENITKIGNSAFSDCAVSSITLPSVLSYIGDNIFYSCPLKTITYLGTKTQWLSISKSTSWDAGIDEYNILYKG